VGHLIELWLPILACSILVFIASSVIWMALPIHKKDYRGLPNENAIVEPIRQQRLTPGVYMFPWADCHGKKLTDAEKAAHAEKFKQGPWGTLTIGPGGFNFGKTLGTWFAHILIVTCVIAYLTSVALPAGAHYLSVFRVAGTAALLAYAGGALPRCIWEGKPWSQLPAALFDGVVYTAITAGTFGWLWPHAAG
jgi:hypothetical protein